MATAMENLAEALNLNSVSTIAGQPAVWSNMFMGHQVAHSRALDLAQLAQATSARLSDTRQFRDAAELDPLESTSARTANPQLATIGSDVASLLETLRSITPRINS